MKKLKLLLDLTKLYWRLDMTNWKTTLTGLLAAAGQILSIFGVPVEVGAAVSTIGLFLLGLFSKDLNVTGGTVSQVGKK